MDLLIKNLSTFRLSKIANGTSLVKVNISNLEGFFKMCIKDMVNCAEAVYCCCFADLSMLNMQNITREVFLDAIFTKGTKFPTEFEERIKPKQIYDLGKIFGFGIEKVHKAGILGKGVNIAVISQPSAIFHSGFKDRIINRTGIIDKEPNSETYEKLSCLVDKNYGISPRANVYLYTPNGDFDKSNDQNLNVLNQIYEYNRNIIADCSKINIIVTIDSLGDGDRYNELKEKLATQGCYIIDEDTFFKYFAISKPVYNDDVTNIIEHVQAESYYCDDNKSKILLPSGGKIIALPAGSNYAYSGGADCWRSIMYLAGMFALVLEVCKDAKFDDFIKVACETADKNSQGDKCINVYNIIKAFI